MTRRDKILWIAIIMVSVFYFSYPCYVAYSFMSEPSTVYVNRSAKADKETAIFYRQDILNHNH